MKKLIGTLIVLAGLAKTILSQNASTEEYENGAFRSAILGSQVFAAQLYEAVAEDNAGNVVLAPLSVALLLALLRMGTGASGPSALQLTDALHVGQDAFLLSQGFRELIDRLPNSNDTSDNELILFLENRMFVQQGFDIEENFLEVAENDFRSGVQEVDFSGDTEGSQQIINDWVKNSTMGRITDLIPDGSLSPDSRLVLVNAIYFKGAWIHPFNEANTEDEPFYISDSDEVSVPMMHGSFTAQYGRATNADATSLILPYRGTGVQAYMLIILPNSVDGMAELEENLYQIQFTYETREVDVSLPKFEFESSTQLNNYLKELGISTIFGPEANLSEISDQEDLYVSEILQKAFISVNENGTEATAATAVIISSLASVVYEDPPVEFKADHPFIFLLTNEDDIFFIGRVNNPQV